MKPRTKERLMTGGVVVLICATGVVLPGCGVNQQRIVRNPSTGEIIASQSPHQCTTDFDCEMHAMKGTKHREAPPRWKLWTTIGLGVVVTGYLYAQRQSNGADQRQIDIFTPKVGCDGSCAQ